MKKVRSMIAAMALGALTLSGCSLEDLMFWKKFGQDEQQQKDDQKQDGKDQTPGGDTTPSGGDTTPGGDDGGQTTVVNVQSVSLDHETATLEIGQSVTLHETVLPANATNKNVTWSATGEGIVSVDDGVVTALAAGTSVVTVKTADGNKTDSCTVTVNPEAAPVDIAYSDGTFEFNGNQQPGKFVYWAGDGGSVSSATYNADTQKYSLAFTTGWAWYGVQVFYLLPYAEATDEYDISWVVNSTIAMNITVNGEVKGLSVGDNTISFTKVGLHQGRTLNVQLGVDGVDGSGKTGTLTFANPEVYDKSNNRYHEISFSKESTLLKKIQVKEGKFVTAPSDPAAPSGQVFSGWFDGETKFDATQAVNAAHAYVARFIDESLATKYTVSVYDGETLLGTIQVLEGSKVDLSSIVFPFGYESDGYFKNAGLSEAFDPAAEIINENTTIYAKKRVAVTSASYNMYDDYVSHLADGSLQIQLTGWGANVWDVQLNYVLPEGNHNYTINYVYSIDKAGADVQIYDNATKAGPNTLVVGNNQNGSLNYNGALTSQNKLTFELGALPSEQTATFVLHSISLTIA